MANSFFQFKQFRIDQAGVAMKVTTDACLFGAWVASLGLAPRRMLDIGSGTGLLALMLAQKFVEAEIIALEIEEHACERASENSVASSWEDRIAILHSSLQNYKSESSFDLIISNPPFFSKSLKSKTNGQNLAIHDDSLTQEELLAGIKRNLSPEGKAFVLYPPNEMDSFIALARANGLFVREKVDVYDRPNSYVLRTMACFGFKNVDLKIDSIVIKSTDNDYTDQFKTLLSSYYLHL